MSTATPSDVRSWARRVGLDVADVGRIPAHVWSLYETANRASGGIDPSRLNGGADTVHASRRVAGETETGGVLAYDPSWAPEVPDVSPWPVVVLLGLITFCLIVVAWIVLV